MPNDPVFRLARAVVFAAVCTALAVAGHSAAAHAPVPPAAVGAGLAGLTIVAVVLAGTERSLGTIAAGLLGGQFMLHVLFAAAQHGQHLAHHPAASGAHGAPAMTFAHVAAAVASAWWLRRGERAVWRLARRAAAAAARPLRALLSTPAPLAAPSRRPVPAGPVIRPPDRVLRHVLTRRGPPAPFPAFR
ncbi:MFS transporter [Actinoallomurus spadix]|uniref:MFS transporter n=1 Tax=Actinoallomurus spadix TaxID=79912 RepID=A0ABP3G953_9ACTN|nr:MFS transporter [Actinoallomurus spadix]MCO5989414.1 MFS transporter [Actinoallomurus spadix]